jgi:hypothetical protein
LAVEGKGETGIYAGFNPFLGRSSRNSFSILLTEKYRLSSTKPRRLKVHGLHDATPMMKTLGRGGSEPPLRVRTPRPPIGSGEAIGKFFFPFGLFFKAFKLKSLKKI